MTRVSSQAISVGRGQDFQRPHGDVAQVSDRGSDQVQAGSQRRRRHRLAMEDVASGCPGRGAAGSAEAAGAVVLMPPNLAARPGVVIAGVKNHYPFHLVNRSPSKCRLQACTGGDMMHRRRGGPAPCFEHCRPGARGLRAPLRPGSRPWQPLRPARRLLGNAGDLGAGSSTSAPPPPSPNDRRRQGQGRPHPAAVGNRQCGGRRAIHAQCRRDGARGIQQPGSPAAGEGRRRHRAGRPAGGAAGARRGRRNHPRPAVRARRSVRSARSRAPATCR